MANTSLKFYRGAAPATPAAGYIWFDSANSTIKVYTGTAWESYAGKLIDASWDESKKTLTLVKQDGSSSTINFSDVASASALSALTSRVGSLEAKHVASKTVAQEAEDAISGIAAVSKANAAGSDVVVTVGTKAGSVASVAVDASVLAKKVSDEASARATGDSATLSSAKSYTDEEVKKVKESVASVYKVKGSCLYADLAKKTDAAVGDVWNVTDAHGDVPAGTNYVWTGEDWDALGGTIDLSPYAKKADLNSVGTGTGSFVKSVTQTNGVVSVVKGNIAAADVPELPQSKITNLVSDLSGKVPTTRTINGLALSSNVTLDGSNTKLSGSYKIASVYADPVAGDSIDSAIGALAKGISDAKASGVTSFAGETGAITLATAGTANGSVNLVMKEKALGATIVGLGSAAFTNSSAYDAAGSAAAVKGDKTKDTAASETVYGAIAKAAAAQSAAAAASSKVDTSIAALDVSGNVSTAVKGLTVTVNEVDGKVQKPVVAIADGTVGGASDANLVTGAVVKTYVDSAVKSNTTMTWASFE